MAIRLTPQEPENGLRARQVLIQLSADSALHLDFRRGDIQAAE
jgi:hypothetical protein